MQFEISNERHNAYRYIVAYNTISNTLYDLQVQAVIERI